jgi:hypothetical protein
MQDLEFFYSKCISVPGLGFRVLLFDIRNEWRTYLFFQPLDFLSASGFLFVLEQKVKREMCIFGDSRIK